MKEKGFRRRSNARSFFFPNCLFVFYVFVDFGLWFVCFIIFLMSEMGILLIVNVYDFFMASKLFATCFSILCFRKEKK